MSEQQPGSRERPFRGRELTDLVIRLALVGVLVVWTTQVVRPFLALLIWSVILAVTLYPLQQRLARCLGQRQGRAAVAIVLLGLLLVGGPSLVLGGSFAGFVHDVRDRFASGEVEVKPPPASVAEWPLIGEKVHEEWSEASADLPAYLEKLQPQLGNVARKVLALAASTVVAVGLFILALIVAGVIMAYGESGSASALRIIRRVAGPERGPRIHRLVTATTRSVAMGVVGVALIQAVLLGVGFIAAGVPAAGPLALVVLLVGIVQLPATLVSLPVIAYLWWSGDSTASNVVFTVYLLVAGFADNVLKPMLLGRGVEVPMPVILIGALGGMVVSGLVGLFVGAVVLAVVYQLLMAWVSEDDPKAPDAAGAQGPGAADGQPPAASD